MSGEKLSHCYLECANWYQYHDSRSKLDRHLHHEKLASIASAIGALLNRPTTSTHRVCPTSTLIARRGGEVSRTLAKPNTHSLARAARSPPFNGSFRCLLVCSSTNSSFAFTDSQSSWVIPLFSKAGLYPILSLPSLRCLISSHFGAGLPSERQSIVTYAVPSGPSVY